MTGFPAPRRLWRRAALATTALAAVLVVAVAQGSGDEQAPESVVTDAAREAVVDLMSYDHRTLDEDLARAAEHTTGEFRTAFQTGTAEHRDEFLELESVATATVLEAAATSVRSDHASVLLFVDQSVTNQETGGKPRLDRLRVKADLTLTDGRWLISKIDFA